MRFVWPMITLALVALLILWHAPVETQEIIRYAPTKMREIAPEKVCVGPNCDVWTLVPVSKEE